MAGIFISYRREDSAPWAGRIYERLARDLKTSHIFMDVDNIAPGIDFVKEVERQIGACDVLIAVIGKGWIEARNSKGVRRINDPQDLVRLELATALARNILVIPVLVDGATLPKAEELSDILRPLIRRNAIELTHVRFGTDVQRLVDTVAQVVNRSSETQSPRQRGAQGGTTGDPATRKNAYVAAVFIVLAMFVSVVMNFYLLYSFLLLTADGILIVSAILLILMERSAKPIGIAATSIGIGCFVYVYISWLPLLRAGAISGVASAFPLIGAVLLAVALGFLLRWRPVAVSEQGATPE